MLFLFRRFCFFCSEPDCYSPLILQPPVYRAISEHATRRADPVLLLSGKVGQTHTQTHSHTLTLTHTPAATEPAIKSQFYSQTGRYLYEL